MAPTSVACAVPGRPCSARSASSSPVSRCSCPGCCSSGSAPSSLCASCRGAGGRPPPPPPRPPRPPPRPRPPRPPAAPPAGPPRTPPPSVRLPRRRCRPAHRQHRRRPTEDLSSGDQEPTERGRMPGHPIDVMVDDLVRAAVRVAPRLEAPLRALSAGDRQAVAQSLDDSPSAGGGDAVGTGGAADRTAAADEAAVAAAFGRLSRLLALVALPDGGARQMVQLAGSIAQVDADLERVLGAISLASPRVRSLCELAALQVPGLLQWQAMLPPNNPWSGDLSLAVLDQVATAGASLVASAEGIDPRTGQIARLWLADIDRRAGRPEQAFTAARAVEAVAADVEVRGYVE